LQQINIKSLIKKKKSKKSDSTIFYKEERLQQMNIKSLIKKKNERSVQTQQ